MVSTCPLISKCSSLCTNPLVTVPSALITIGITVTFMFHSFFQFSSKVLVLISFFVFLLFYPVVSQNGKVHYSAGCFFLLTITRSGLLAEIRWSVCISKSQRILCVSFSRMDSELCIYHLFVWSKWNFLHNSQWITFPIQPCLVLFSFCTNLLHSLIMGLIISSLVPHNLCLLFCFALSIRALTYLVLMALFYAAIRRHSFSFLRFLFLRQVRFRLFVAWNVHTILFLPIFVSWFFVLLMLVCIVFGSCNQFSSALFMLFSCCIDWTLSLMQVNYLPSSFLGTYILFISSYPLSWVFLFFGPFVGINLWSTLRIVPCILRGGHPRCLSLWLDFCYVVWFKVVFSFSWGILFF